jgi:hypothetical protein
MKKTPLVLLLVLSTAASAAAVDFRKITPALGPRSFTLNPFISLSPGFLVEDDVADFNAGAGLTADWGISDLPLTVGGSYSVGLFIGEMTVRFGYHPDLGIKNLDLYLVLTIGVANIVVIPASFMIGPFAGIRYYVNHRFGVMGEAGYAFDSGTFLRIGLSIKWP